MAVYSRPFWLFTMYYNIYLKPNEWKGTTLHSFGTNHARGVSILLRNNFDMEVMDEYNEKEGRILMMNVKVGSTCMTFVTIYAPNDEYARKAFFKNL